jgi:AcrR family transcriptional regulator
MTLPPPHTRRDAEHTRARLLSAARDLFSTIGFRATTTPMLAQRAGIAEGTIYRHFTGKAELLNAVYLEVQVWGLGVIREVESARAPRAAERLQSIARRLLEQAARDPAAIRLLLQAREQQYLDDRSRESARAFRSALEQVMASGKSDGVIRPGPVELWTGVWLAVVAFAAERVAAGDWHAEHPQAALALEAAWSAIAATGVPERT